MPFVASLKREVYESESKPSDDNDKDRRTDEAATQTKSESIETVL